jgi:YggT family protein
MPGYNEVILSNSPPTAVMNTNILANIDTNLVSLVLGIALGLYILLFIVRIVLTWYPQVAVDKFPFNVAVVPTELPLSITRKLIPPIGGVDITPIIWVGIISLVREVLIGQQGLLTMLSR